MSRVEKEKKDGLQKIQTMHQEIRDLKTKLADFEANKAKEIKKLEDSLTETLKSNKKAQVAISPTFYELLFHTEAQLFCTYNL